MKMIYQFLKKTTKTTTIASALLVGILLTGCASQSLEAPCPGYGAHCDKTPINSWDTSAI